MFIKTFECVETFLHKSALIKVNIAFIIRPSTTLVLIALLNGLGALKCSKCLIQLYN